ncbi:hypothetical protein ACQYAD_14655 [Neobacillus sp. SM06]|uniref:hypothetical protein n=1 Tax=Neobacillus sp. SM06 TaxID=3422492 RepID=UPI003D2DAB8E
METLYDKLPVEVLAQFFFYINKNIDDGILTEAMYHEVDLIVKALEKQGKTIGDLNVPLGECVNI